MFFDIPLFASSALAPIDWIVLAAYFLLIFGLAVFLILRSKNTSGDYFLAGHSLGWIIVGASIFASNIGSEHLVGLAGSGASEGITLANFELHAWCLLVLAWVFIPFYVRSGVFTMPEFLERRFSPAARWVLSLISLVAYVVTKIAVGIFAGGIVFKVLLPDWHLFGFDSFWIGSVLVIVLTGFYTMLGGMKVVAYTESVQTFILILGSILVTLFGLMALGRYDSGDGSIRAGWKNLRAVCANKAEGRDMFNLWKPLLPAGIEGTWCPVIERAPSPSAEDSVSKEKTEGKIVRQAWYFKDRSQGSHYPWIGMLFCAPIIGLWYWCTDQYIVQRALSAKNEREARRGSIFAAYLKLLPVFIFIIPGMICFALAFYGEAGVSKMVQKGADGSIVPVILECQGAFPIMVREVLPPGIRGIVVAGLLSALMSSLAGVFNASATLFTMDFYQKIRKGASERQLVWIGRTATAVMVLIGLAWIPIIQGKNGLYDYLQSVQGYFAPPIIAVFLYGVFSRRANAPGAVWTLLIGFALGLFRLVIDTLITMGVDFPDGSLCWIVNNVYFQYYSLMIFAVCMVSMPLISRLTSPPEREKTEGLTFATTTDAQRKATRSTWNYRDVLASIFVLLGIIAAYLYFVG
ncbi:MAG: sodium:solute symporter [Planctomycetia bacterium]|nr:sodium:solute symporter [Planctomycetia bacterium]